MDVNVSTNDAARRLPAAIQDIVDGVRAYPVWSTLGWQDIRQRYRRSVIGPFWITLTMLVTIVGMGPLYGMLLKADLTQFIPYLALGIITWGLLSTLIIEGGTCFSSSDTIIRSVRLPLSLYILRGIYRNVLIFMHNIVAYLPVMLYLGIAPKLTWLLAIPGILILIAAAFPVSIILGIFCTRFRDMQPIVNSIVQLAFFVTPIIWRPESLGRRAWVAHFNPLYFFLEMVRGPIYGEIPQAWIYWAAGAVTVGLYLVALPMYARFRARIAFWI